MVEEEKAIRVEVDFFLLFTFDAISRLCVGRFWSFFDEMISTSNLRNSGENRILLSEIRKE